MRALTITQPDGPTRWHELAGARFYAEETIGDPGTDRALILAAGEDAPLGLIQRDGRRWGYAHMYGQRSPLRYGSARDAAAAMLAELPCALCDYSAGIGHSSGCRARA